MANIIFVHGTGVREPGYSATFVRLAQSLKTYAPGWEPVPCFWGEACGAKLRQGGASIPGYDTARGIAGVDSADEELALWGLLYEDPYYELRLLALHQGDREPLAPNEEPPWRALRRQIEQFQPSPEFRELLQENALEQVWDDAFRAVVDSPAFEDTLKVAAGTAGDRAAIARAMVAQATRLALEQGIPPLAGPVRDRIVERFVADSGGQERGIIFDWLKGQLKGLALRLATYKMERKRGALSDITCPVAGDILLYQSRGAEIRQFIRDQVAKAQEPVVLLAHSLGGIACVDLLVFEHLPAVKGLITVGSQAALFYELDCLTSRRFGEPLPDHFPPWLNIYDPHDFLSYIGAIIFSDRVKDVEVASGQPFPVSHSAYWSNPEVWKPIAEFLSCH